MKQEIEFLKGTVERQNDRLEDLENGLRRNNIRIVGLPERSEGNNMRDLYPRGKIGGKEGRKKGKGEKTDTVTGLREIWSERHPTTQMFSWHSGTYSSLSRRDMAIGNDTLATMVTDIKYEASGFFGPLPSSFDNKTGKPVGWGTM